MSYSEFVGALLALDPKHLDSNSDIDDMKKALPPIWEVERAALAKTWV